MKSQLIFNKGEFSSCHASTIVEATPGNFLAAWFGGAAEGKSDVKIWMARFDGSTWSKPELIAQELATPCWNPVFFNLGSGNISLWYKAGVNPMCWSAFLRRSKDGGKTWDMPEQYPAGLLGPIRAKPIRLKNGAILAWSSVESYRACTSWVERSTDDGKSWKRFGPIQVSGHTFGIIQPTLYETNDGRIVALCRSRNLGAIYQSESKDGGETWSDAMKTDLPNPDSGIDVVRLKSGDLVLIYNHTRFMRTPLNLARSSNDGKTWTAFKTLESEPGEYSYPAIIEASDGKLHMTYTWRRTHIKHVIVDPSE
jgi:predicted neuraminidase